MKFLRFSFQFKKVVMFLGEGALIFFSVLAGVYFRLGTLDYDWVIPKALLTAVVCLTCLYYGDLYNSKVIANIRELLIRLMQALGVATIILAALYYVFPVLIIGRGVSLISASIILPLILVWRLIYRRFLMWQGMEENILIIGTNPFAVDLAEEIADNRTLGYRVIGFIDKNPGREVGNPLSFPVLGDFNDIPQIVEELEVTRIVVSVDERRGRLPMDVLLECRMKGIDISEDVGFYERITGKILVDKLRPSWLIFSSGFEQLRFQLVFKRFYELVTSTAALIVLLPVIVAVAVAVKLDSQGPVFFKQERVGQNGEIFTVYKFRSMREDAEEETGPVWAAGDDSRVTRVGRFIRKTRLDELPQLFNVFRGHMSFVGPRPERPFFVEQLSKEIPYYVKRHAVKPGITGWAQVRYSYGASVEDAKEKLQYDLYYVKNLSLLLDLEVIVDTFKVVVLGKGAR